MANSTKNEYRRLAQPWCMWSVDRIMPYDVDYEPFSLTSLRRPSSAVHFKVHMADTSFVSVKYRRNSKLHVNLGGTFTSMPFILSFKLYSREEDEAFNTL